MTKNPQNKKPIRMTDATKGELDIILAKPINKR